jgi:hypothetical protein
MAQLSVVLRMIWKVLVTWRACVGVNVTEPVGELTLPDTERVASCPRSDFSSAAVSDTSTV